MVESIALRIARAIKRVEPEKTASLELLKFSLEGLINTFIVVFLIGCVGVVTGTLENSLLAFFSFAFLRFFSGGLHMRKALHCSLLSTVLIASAPHIHLQDNFIVIVGIISILLIFIFAPSNIEGHAKIPSKHFIYLKFISVLIIGSNFLFLNSTISVVFAIQALTTIQIKRR